MRKAGNILVADDNKNILISVKMLLSNIFNNVVTLSSPASLITSIRENQIDVVLLDMNFTAGINNGNEGVFWLQEIKRHYPDVQVVLFTAYADIELAVKSIKLGAFNFVEKPWDNQKLIDVLQSACRAKKDRVKKGEEKAAANETEEPLYWGTTPIMKQLKEMVEKVALTDADILITGENGTGKDLLARQIHALSCRAGQKIISVDMGAITETLFESELFGHVKGAFTDAHAERVGYMEEAAGGTLFLDEIGNLPLHQQSKLLNVLQRRCVTKVGSNKVVPIDIRLICATNKNLPEMVAKGEFREDLFYRINTIHLELPPLRERRADIVPLAEHFLELYGKKYNRELSFSPEAKKGLEASPWRGNIRELRHVVEKAVIMSSTDMLSLSDLQLEIAPATENGAQSKLAEVESMTIRQTLKNCGGNLSLTAQTLGISRQTLYNKIKRYGIELP